MIKNKFHISIRVKLLILVLLSINLLSTAKSFDIQGKIISQKTQKPLELIVIKIPQLNLWTTSDSKGRFYIKNISNGIYNFELSSLGYKSIIYKVNTSKIKHLKFEMQENSLGLDEIVVTAKENTNIGSSSKIEQSALEYIQPTNLGDISQLLPGGLLTNTDMNKNSSIVIRDLGTSAQSSFGTSIIVDGVEHTNDGGLQTLSTVKGVGTKMSTFNSGIDTRQVTTNNIESIEVIRGVASAEYGNLTTGAVIVKTKAGKTPLNIKTKLNPNFRQFYVEKGVYIKKLGTLNLNIDYTNSYKDRRFNLKQFNRLSGQLAYSNSFFKESKPLTLNVKVGLSKTLDNQPTDSDMLRDDKVTFKEKRYKFSINGKYLLRNTFITNLRYHFSYSNKHEESYEKKLLYTVSVPLSTSLSEGLHRTSYLPMKYYYEYYIKGQPISYNLKLDADKSITIKGAENLIKYGIQWKRTKNNGDGKIYDPQRPPLGFTTSSLRRRAFKDIPALETMAYYFENKLALPIYTTKLTIQAGIRYENLQPDGIFKSKFDPVIEPRINVGYVVFNKRNNDKIKLLKFTMGYGIQSKSPSISHLYPDKAYFDFKSFDNKNLDLVALTTKIVDDTSNPDLKYARNKKIELGVQLKVSQFSLHVTAFREKLTNGIGFMSSFVPVTYKRYRDIAELKKENLYNDQDLLVDNDMVYYEENGNRVELPHKTENRLMSYSSPENYYNQIKRGVEYTLDLGKIERLHTKVRFDGAWFQSERYNTKPSTKTIRTFYNGEYKSYKAVFDHKSIRVAERFNTNCRLITHIPKLKMVFTTSIQSIWYTKGYKKDVDHKGNSVAYIGVDQKRVDNTENLKETDTYSYYINPSSYLDDQANQHSYTTTDENDVERRRFRKSYNKRYYKTTKYPSLFVLNFRVKKEIGDIIELSFYANNMFYYQPFQKSNTGYLHVRRNSQLFFGAEVKLKL